MIPAWQLCELMLCIRLIGYFLISFFPVPTSSILARAPHVQFEPNFDYLFLLLMRHSCHIWEQMTQMQILILWGTCFQNLWLKFQGNLRGCQASSRVFLINKDLSAGLFHPKLEFGSGRDYIMCLKDHRSTIWTDVFLDTRDTALLIVLATVGAII